MGQRSEPSQRPHSGHLSSVAALAGWSWQCFCRSRGYCARRTALPQGCAVGAALAATVGCATREGQTGHPIGNGGAAAEGALFGSPQSSQKTFPGSSGRKKKRPFSGRKFAALCHGFLRAAAILERDSGLFFFRPGPPGHGFCQADATFQWDRFLAAQKPEGHRVVRINMDETSLKLFPGAGPGCVAPSEGKKTRHHVEQGVSMRAQRGALSLLAFVTDDPEIQSHLPQVLIGNARLIPEPVARDFTAARQDRLFLLRRKSSWVQAKGLAEIVRLLGACLQPLAAGKFFILSMDACPVHITSVVLRAVASVGLHFQLIPAQATRWLQPCDVAVFGALKHHIRRRHLEQQLRRGRAELDVAEVLQVFATAISEVICSRPWTRAFALCGLHEGPPLSKRFLEALGSGPLPACHARVPSLEQLQCVFPRRRDIPIELLFQNLLRPVPVGVGRRGLLPRVTEGARRPSAKTSARPWLGRTRSSSRVSLASAGMSARAQTGSLGSDSQPPLPRATVPIAHRLWPWRPPLHPHRRSL